MEKILLIVGFLIIRYLISASQKSKKAAPKPKPKAPSPAKSRKSMDDIFGDFMKEINQEQTVSHTKPVMQSSKGDFHRAEEDSNEKLDWQEVSKAKSNESIEMLKYKDIYRKRKASAVQISDPVLVEVDNEEILENFDLRKALIYKEVLDRKYFSI